MKLKQKLLVTAVAAAAAFAAPAANATIQFGGNGELFLTVYDLGLDLDGEGDNRAYVLDLGGYIAANGYANPFGRINDWSSFAAVPELSANKQFPAVGGTVFTLAPDANLQSFLAATDDLSRLQWNIVAGDNSGVRRLLFTSLNGVETSPIYTDFRTLVGRIGTYLPYPNDNGIVEDGSVLLNGPTAGIPAWGNNFAGMSTSASSNFTNAGHIGDQLGFYLMSEHVASGSTTTRALVQQYMGDGGQAYWHLDASGTLTYNVPAIPEPSEYALMLAGLGMLGFMARRRLANRG